MLELKKITKTYETEGFKQTALNKVSVNFRENEFAAILGPSGSGKTTFLNIIGGLDDYTSGDLVINEVSTKKFTDRDWDGYRNHRVGFVFQSYNLISHQTVLKNVELALTLSGFNKTDRRKKAIKALKDVGLKDHINKKPNQLSGGQMQRVAIARALVNDPEIILADEPTGALDSETSIQIMDLLKKIAKERLVIMVTHNPDLADEYANRIINIKDGKIISDTNPYDGKVDTTEGKILADKKNAKTRMSFFTALSLSFNNLMTKKGRTILVSAAGSIGIIGIALILAVSTGFQNYVDSIQEDTLSSYPLTIMQKQADITGTLLSMREGNKKSGNGSKKVKEQQYITTMLSNISTNDLKSLKKYTEKNEKVTKKDLTNIMYSYSVDPNIYTIDATKKLAKVNPSNLFDSMMGSNNLFSSYSAMASIFTQMVDDRSELEDDYDVLAGRWPKKYDELIIVLSEPNGISDLLVYSLGLRDTDELTKMVTKIMNGEEVNINNKPKTFTYEDLMNVDLRLIIPADRYRYNPKYDVYEDMAEDEKYMNNLYKNSQELKIVGVVSAKEGKTSTALNPGVAYTSDLIDYIIDYSKSSDIVRKQLKNKDVDVFSGKKFDDKKNDFDFDFEDLVRVDTEKLQSAFNINIDQKQIENQTKNYMNEIANSITADINPAKDLFNNNLNTFIDGVFNDLEEFSSGDIEKIVNDYLNGNDPSNRMSNMEAEYVIPKDVYKTTYSGLLKGLLSAYVSAYNAYAGALDPNYKPDVNTKIKIVDDMKETVIKGFVDSALIKSTAEKMGIAMTEAKVKKEVLTKVGELTANLTSSFASAFNVDEDKIASAFTLNFSEDELTRVVSSLINPVETNQKTNLISLGYQDKDEPTYISYYFKDFDTKEHFLKFLDKYNKKVDEDKKINYSDTTGILMSSVKTIVNAVSYVLIAFVSISLVVSSIMIGVITYISVYERTKEIGILRAIGASKGNISSIFNAETFIIGLLSGLIGISVSFAAIPIINKVLHHYTGNIPLSAKLNIGSAIVLVVLAIVLTLIGGLIPVESLRSE